MTNIRKLLRREPCLDTESSSSELSERAVSPVPVHFKTSLISSPEFDVEFDILKGLREMDAG